MKNVVKEMSKREALKKIVVVVEQWLRSERLPIKKVHRKGLEICYSIPSEYELEFETWIFAVSITPHRRSFETIQRYPNSIGVQYH